MDRFCKIHYSVRVFSGLVFLMLFSLLQPVSSVVAGSHAITRSAVVTIMGKTTDAVTISERDFMVSGETVILNEMGEKIDLNDLAVPCTAEVEYQLRMDKSPLCLRIYVKKLEDLSRQDWSSSDYEGGK